MALGDLTRLGLLGLVLVGAINLEMPAVARTPKLKQLLCQGNGTPPPVTFEQQLAEAQDGDDDAQLQVGLVLLNKGIKDEAFKWLYRSAEQDNNTAQVHVGDCYANGIGTTKDLLWAYGWYETAVPHGYEASMKLAAQRLAALKKRLSEEQQRKGHERHAFIGGLTELTDTFFAPSAFYLALLAQGWEDTPANRIERAKWISIGLKLNNDPSAQRVDTMRKTLEGLVADFTSDQRAQVESAADKWLHEHKK